MRRTSVHLAAAIVALVSLLGAAQAASAGGRFVAPRGDLIVTFSGSGGGSYRFHQPGLLSAAVCRSGDSTYAETDSYSWSYTFVVPPTGGSSIAPASMTGTGLLSSVQQTRRCGGTTPTTTTCTQMLRPPTQADEADLAFPGLDVVASARQITVGALGELLRAGSPTCSGDGSLIPNVVRGYLELQASVTFPRSVLARPNGYSGTFTMAGAGLYAGVALSGSCSSIGCDPATCAQDEPGPPGAPPSSCNFGEGYSGAIEVRVVR